MPYQWVPAALFLEHQGVAIYRTYRHDVDTEMRTYHFVRDEWEGEDGDTAFDVRELSTWEPVAAPPTLCGAATGSHVESSRTSNAVSPSSPSHSSRTK